MKKQIASKIFLALIVLAAASASAQAQIVSLPVEDPTFSSPVVGDGSEGLLEGSNHITGVPYTESSFGAVGIEDPNNEEFSGPSTLNDNPLPGAGVGFQTLKIQSFSGDITATYNAGNLGNFTPGDTYTLTVAIGDGVSDAASNEVGGTYSIDLLENGTAIKTATSLAQVGTFTDLSLTFTAGASDTGAINFDLGLTAPPSPFGKETFGFFNDVTLTAQAAPEPSSYALSLIVAAVMGAFLFKRNRTQA